MINMNKENYYSLYRFFSREGVL